MVQDKGTARAQEEDVIVIQKPLNQLLAEHPDRVAAGLFIFLTVIFFFDALFTGKLFPGQQHALMVQSVLGKAFLHNGSYPLWTPYIFAGMPSFASLIFTPFSYFLNYPFLILNYLVTTPVLLHIVHYPLAGLGVYLFLRDRQIDFVPAFFSGIAFMFSPHIVALETAGHSLQLMAVAWIPMVLWATSRLLRQGGLTNYALASLILGLQLQTGHAQIIAYTLLFLFLYFAFFIFALIREKSYKRIGWTVLFFSGVLLLAFCLAAIKLLPLYEYLPHSMRGSAAVLNQQNASIAFENAAKISFSYIEIIPFFLPSFLGFSKQPLYWGTLPLPGHPLYLGLPVLILAVIALIFRRKELIIVFLVTSTILAAIQALGSNIAFFNKFLFTYFPFFNAFRHPLAAFVFVPLCLAFLAGYGLQFLITFFKTVKSSTRNFKQVVHNLFIGIGILLVLTILFAIFKTNLFHLLQAIYPDQHLAPRQLQIDRLRFVMLRNDWLLLILWLAACAGVTSLALRRYIGRTAFALGITIITLADLWRVDFRLNTPAAHLTAEAGGKSAEIASYLQADTSLFRVLPTGRLSPELGNIAPGLQSLTGKHPAGLRLFQDFLHFSGLQNTFVEKYYHRSEAKSGVVFEPVQPGTVSASQRIFQRTLLDMLNVKYVLSTLPIPEPNFILRRQGQHIIGDQQLPLLLYENLQAMPRAFFVDSYLLADSLEKAIELLKSTEFSPRKTVVLQKMPAILPEPDSTAQCDITDYQPNRIEIKTASKKGQILVITDSFYAPAWHARIDGNPREILQANFAFRAIYVPAGQHKVVMYFNSPAFGFGIGLTLLGSAVLAGCFIYPWRKKRRQGKS